MPYITQDNRNSFVFDIEQGDSLESVAQAIGKNLIDRFLSMLLS